MNDYNKHYITVDALGRIVDGFSDAFRLPSETDICINDNGGYQFRLFKDGEENPALCVLHKRHLIPLYKYANGEVKHRSDEEIAADIAAIPDPENEPSQLDMLEAQVTYTAMMTDTLLEV